MLLLFSFLLYIIITLFLSSILYPMPLSDLETVRHRTIPWMTFGLILVNSLVFIALQAPNYYQGLQAFAEEDMRGMDLLYNYVVQLYTFGFRGALLREPAGIGAFNTFTAMFMHGDMWHLLGNMIYLWTFGRRLEDACGPWRFLLFYLTAGLVAHLGTAVFMHEDRPSVGASGAIAGVMGAYLVLFPGSMVLSFWGIGILLRFPIVLVLKIFGAKSVAEARLWRWTIRLPAWMLLIAFLVMEVVPSIQIMQGGEFTGGTNHIAHLAGFLAAVAIFLYARKDVVKRYVAGRAI